MIRVKEVIIPNEGAAPRRAWGIALVKDYKKREREREGGRENECVCVGRLRLAEGLQVVRR